MGDLYLSTVAESAVSRILACYYRPKPGGFCKRLFRALTALINEGHEVHYLSLEPFPINHENCRFHQFWWPFQNRDNSIFWVVFHLIAPILLFWLSIRYRIDRMLAFGANYAALMQPAAVLLRKPLIFFVRADQPNNDLLRFRSPWVGRVASWLESFGMYRSSVVAVSHALKKQLLLRHPNIQGDSIAVLPNEIPLPCVLPEKNNEGGVIRFSCVGILEHIKNQQFVIAVLAEMSMYPWQLNIFGIGPNEAALKQLVDDFNMADRVRFMGWQDSGNVWRQTDVLLFPSISEGSPNVLLEAVANRIPVLASDIEANREILGGVGTISLGDKNAWRLQIGKLLFDSKQRRDLVAAQSDIVHPLRFDWDAALCRHLASPQSVANLSTLP